VTGETQENQHCNGQWFEAQIFKCGYVQEWVPNFSAMRVTRACPKSAEEVEDQLQRDALDQELLEVLRASKAPPKWVVGRMKALGFYDQAAAWYEKNHNGQYQ
jgi:hypothetical protein